MAPAPAASADRDPFLPIGGAPSLAKETALSYRGRMTTQETTQPRQLGSMAVFPLSLGCMGMSGMYGPARRRREHRHHPRRARPRRQPARHRRLLRHGPQRDAASAARSARRAATRRCSRVKFGAHARPDGAWLGFDARPAAVKNFARLHPDPARRRSHRHLPPGAARPGGADRGDHRRHRRPRQGRLRARTSGCPRSAPRPSAARRPCTRSPTCRSSTR